MYYSTIFVVFVSSLSIRVITALDPDALSQRYRNWTYYPDYIIPPLCLNPVTCPSHCNATFPYNNCQTDVFQIVQLPDEVEQNIFRAFYLQYDGYGYETYSAISTDLVHFNVTNPGVVFSPRANRPGYPKPNPGEFDYASQTFVGPLLMDYNVSQTRVLRRATKNNTFWYAYLGFPTPGYETPPGADGFAVSTDGITWERSIPHPYIDTNIIHRAQEWEQFQVYAPYLIPAPDGTLASFYNAAHPTVRNEQSGAAYLPGGPDALPGYDTTINASMWIRDPANPTLPNDEVASFQAADPKVYYDDVQNVWVLIYFCNGNDSGGGAAICIAFSEDQRIWEKASTPIYDHGGHPNGYDKCHTHKAWLQGDGKTDRLYLYYTGVSGDACQTRGILLLTSTPIE